MPCDVAVDQPGAWIVGAHSDGDITRFWEQDDVTSRWVLKVEIGKAFDCAIVSIVESQAEGQGQISVTARVIDFLGQ